MAKFKFDIPSTDSMLLDLIQSLRINTGGQLTKFTKNSVNRGLLYTISRVLAYAKGYITTVEARRFLSSCYGDDLDNYALEYYNVTRRGASGSSAEVFLTAQVGTLYPAGTQFKSLSGITFVLKSDVLVGQSGNAFGCVESQETGTKTKVYANTIQQIVSPPVGHYSVTNLQPALGGYNSESDEDFRTRLYSLAFQVTNDVAKRMESIVYTLFPDVAKCIASVDASGSTYIGILKNSGADLSSAEIASIKSTLQETLNISNTIYFNVENLRKVPVDVSFTATIASNVSFNDVYQEIQEELLSYLDFRFWSATSVRSEVMVSKLTTIKSILDIELQGFSPLADIETGEVAVPFLRSLEATLNKTSGVTQTLGITRTSIETSEFSPNRKDLLTTFIGG